MKYVIDLSDWQEGICFDEIKKHFDGVIVKITEGRTPQKCWEDFIDEAERHHMPWGVYCYTHAQTTERAREEARVIISLLEKKNRPVLGIWMDIESPDIVGENGTMPMSADEITACASAFISGCNRANHSAGIYAPEWIIRDRINTGDLADYVPYWISAPYATRGHVASLGLNLAGWQYRADSYTMDGWPDALDANEWYTL